MKNSRIAMTWAPERIGIPTPVFKPAIRAAADRGKLGSLVTFSTQAGRFDSHTRPGSPTPGSKGDASETVLKGVSSPSPQYQVETKSRVVPGVFGTHACPSTQPVFSQTSRSTTSNADDRSSAVVNSLVIVCSKLSCSSLSWRFCSALRDWLAFLASLLIS